MGIQWSQLTCIGYLAHPFEKKAVWAFIARLCWLLIISSEKNASYLFKYLAM